ncbi:hypothetical protein MyNCGM683_08440 [Achromobacter xylosoxidans]
MATFSRTGVDPRARAMAGRAVATTVASSICMNSAQPTMKGIMRAARAASGVEGGAGLAAAADSADMAEEGGGTWKIVTPGLGPGCSKLAASETH